jgi:hypothetical protein
VLVAQENFVCTFKWPSLIAKKTEKNLYLRRKKFGRIDSCSFSNGAELITSQIF